MEIDLILAGSEAIVVVIGQEHPTVSDVRDLLDDLRRFTEFSSHYRDYRRLGAVAALSVEEGADRYAYRQGLFVLTMGRESSRRISLTYRAGPSPRGISRTFHPLSPFSSGGRWGWGEGVGATGRSPLRGISI